MSVLSGAVETAPVSDLHARGSVNPDDFAVPGGREEEWRFTPLRRLRGLHKDAPRPSPGSRSRSRPRRNCWWKGSKRPMRSNGPG